MSESTLILDGLAKAEAVIEKFEPVFAAFKTGNVFRLGPHVEAFHKLLANHVDLHGVFVEILRLYELPTPIRRNVEKASLRWSKTKLVLPRDTHALLARAFKMQLEAKHDVDVIRKALAYGKPCVGNVCAVSCFRVVNTGGFDEKTMDTVRAVVDEGVRLLRKHDLDWLCYGDVFVANTVLRSSKVLAFYNRDRDDMFVRANLKKQEGVAVRTFIHELGHRFEARVAKSGVAQDFDRALMRLFTEYKWNVGPERAEVRTARPEPGSQFPINKGKHTFVVGRVIGDHIIGDAHDAMGGIVHNVKIKLASWQEVFLGRDNGLFPTKYASTDKHEFFAEMFAFYVVGEATPKQAKDTKALLSIIPTTGASRGRARAWRSKS